jgi:hypothetical protein
MRRLTLTFALILIAGCAKPTVELCEGGEMMDSSGGEQRCVEGSGEATMLASETDRILTCTAK